VDSNSSYSADAPHHDFIREPHGERQVQANSVIGCKRLKMLEHTAHTLQTLIIPLPGGRSKLRYVSSQRVTHSVRETACVDQYDCAI
jgi:hypothetical protein